jgi:hypothetical protein
MILSHCTPNRSILARASIFSEDREQALRYGSDMTTDLNHKFRADDQSEHDPFFWAFSAALAGASEDWGGLPNI